MMRLALDLSFAAEFMLLGRAAVSLTATVVQHWEASSHLTTSEAVSIAGTSSRHQ